jgi:hypothetical protein
MFRKDQCNAVSTKKAPSRQMVRDGATEAQTRQRTKAENPLKKNPIRRKHATCHRYLFEKKG